MVYNTAHMNTSRLITAIISTAVFAAPLSALASTNYMAPGTPVYGYPQGYSSPSYGSGYLTPTYQQGYAQPSSYYGQQYVPQYYQQPQTSYTMPQYNYGSPYVYVQPINYQPFTQYVGGFGGQQQQQQQAQYAPASYGYGGGYGPNYGYGYPTVTNGYYPQPSYGYSTGPYAGYYGANNPPIDVGYYTGDHDTFGGAICYYADYGRADCGSNPRQPVYDAWTGTWY